MTEKRNIHSAVAGPIGVFDSGYGGLTILREIRQAMPQYDYLYLGDNARAPYGTRSFDIVYRFTLEAVRALFDRGCHLVILACNTASAKALRTIQQNDLPALDPERRVLGVIRPTVESVGSVTKNGHIGIFATPGTVASESYDIEIAKLHPEFTTHAQACPMWVPLVENAEADSDGADYFVKKYVEQLFARAPQTDTIILGCTHYPLLLGKINAAVAGRAQIVSQGQIVAESLADYLKQHPEMRKKITDGGTLQLLTTENPARFAQNASVFLGENDLKATHIDL